MATFDAYFPNLSTREAADLKADLQALGLTERFFPMIRYVKNSEELKDIVYNNFVDGRNVLIFGTMGSGKTQMIRQCAEQCGMRMEEVTVSIHVPEDFGGVPLTLKRDLDDEEFRDFVSDKLFNEKLSDAVDAELQKHPEYGESSAAKRLLRNRLSSTITVSEDEIDSNLERFTDRRQRLEQRTSAPEWVWKIIDNWTRKRKKTVVFLDEINHGRPDVLNTLFQLILDRKFGGEDKYSFGDGVVFAAAGNFPRENQEVQPLSQPLMNRFSTIIIFRTHWKGSISWISSQYFQMRDEYPKLCELLRSSSLTPETWQTGFSTPRNMEEFISTLASYEQIAKKDPAALSRIKSLASINLAAGASKNLRDAVIRFLADIGVPAFANQANATRSGSIPSVATKQRQMMSNLQIAWVNYCSRRVSDLGDKTYIRGQDDKEFIEEIVKLAHLVPPDALVSITDQSGKSIMDAYIEAGGTKQYLESLLN